MMPPQFVQYQRLNPLVAVFETLQFSLGFGKEAFQMQTQLLIMTLVSLSIYLLGSFVASKQESLLAERL